MPAMQGPSPAAWWRTAAYTPVHSTGFQSLTGLIIVPWRSCTHHALRQHSDTPDSNRVFKTFNISTVSISNVSNTEFGGSFVLPFYSESLKKLIEPITYSWTFQCSQNVRVRSVVFQGVTFLFTVKCTVGRPPALMYKQMYDQQSFLIFGISIFKSWNYLIWLNSN